MPENRYIIGDADKKLKLIADQSIKLIYIDPPYNTGSKFIYHDDRETLDWLAFMKTKLQASKRILKEDGVIFISIDDNEFDSLTTLCDEIFGKNNKLGTLITRQATRSNSKHINTIHEYVLCYAKNKSKTKKFEVKRVNIPLYAQAISRLNRSIKMTHRAKGNVAAEKKLRELLAHYEHIDGFSWIKNYNLVDESGNIFFAKDLSMPGKPNSLQIPEIGVDLKPLKSRRWTGEKQILDLHKAGELVFKNGRPYRKSLLIDSKDSLMSFLNFYSRQGTHDLDRLGLKGIFDTPKPVDMIKLFILCVCEADDIVLDYFSGSATTGQAVWEVNQELGYNIKFILIQISEKIGPETTIGKELIKQSLACDISSIGILRLNKVQEKIPNEKFVIEK